MVEGLPPWLRLQSCHPGFESQENHLQLHQFIKLCNVEKTKINKKRPGLVDVKIQHYLTYKQNIFTFFSNIAEPIPTVQALKFHLERVN